MRHLSTNSIANMEFEMAWESPEARHVERYAFPRINVWRDLFPADMLSDLIGKPEGHETQTRIDGSATPFHSGERAVRTLKRNQFLSRPGPDATIGPRVGRFYPKGLLSGVANVFPQNMEPFRMTGIQNGSLSVDLGHPMAGRPIAVTARINRISGKVDERGGSCNDVLTVMGDGPGMQARWQSRPTDFFSDTPFQRDDETDDAAFYQEPRFVHHLDDHARAVVEDLYAAHLKEEWRILDLMSSWTSHLPPTLRPGAVAGLGMNAAELLRNPTLSERTVQDLNRNPELPYGKEVFDAVICTVSVEYLTRPMAVFDEVARVLRPGGKALFTFSNRWFPPKAIHIWRSIHEFERLALVTEYFLHTRRFKDLHTFSMRGLLRPETDRHYPNQIFSDPVYAVWGTRA